MAHSSEARMLGPEGQAGPAGVLASPSPVPPKSSPEVLVKTWAFLKGKVVSGDFAPNFPAQQKVPEWGVHNLAFWKKKWTTQETASHNGDLGFGDKKVSLDLVSDTETTPMDNGLGLSFDSNFGNQPLLCEGGIPSSDSNFRGRPNHNGDKPLFAPMGVVRSDPVTAMRLCDSAMPFDPDLGLGRASFQEKREFWFFPGGFGTSKKMLFPNFGLKRVFF